MNRKTMDRIYATLSSESKARFEFSLDLGFGSPRSYEIRAMRLGSEEFYSLWRVGDLKTVPHTCLRPWQTDTMFSLHWFDSTTIDWGMMGVSWFKTDLSVTWYKAMELLPSATIQSPPKRKPPRG